MSLENIYNFNTPANFVYDNTKIEFSGALARLKLQDNPGQTFTEDFADDTGFTYDSAKAEFVGGVCRQKANNITENYNQPFTSDVGFTYNSSLVEFATGVCRQKSQRPAGATFGATYTSDINGNWGGGTLTGTAVGVPTVSGGKLVLTGGTVRGVTYPSASKFIARQTGCIRLKYTPNYTGVPAGHRPIIGVLQAGAGEANEIFLYHNSSEGKIFLNAMNSALGVIFDGPIGFFLPIADTEYEIEFNWDFTTGASRLFINGIQLGSTITGTGTISSFTIIKVGLNYADNMNSDGSFNDILCFDAPVHTSNYTPGYTVSEYDYLENVVTCPIQNYNYSISSLDVPTITETNTPHYVVNGYYWNGAAWAASSDTYATAMTYAQWVANIATFPAGQLSTGVTIKVIFQGSNTQSSIDSIVFTINESTYLTSAVICPEMEYTGVGTLISFDNLITTETGSVRYTLQIGRSGNYLYWSGSAWVTSDGTYAQATDKTTFNTNKVSLPITGQIYGQFKVHFTNTNTQSNIAELEASLTAQIYPTTNPTIIPVTGIYTDDLISIISTLATSGSDAVKFVLNIDGVDKYYTGTAWASSSGYAQSNTISQYTETVLDLLGISLGVLLKPKVYLHSETGATTPTITSITETYNFFAPIGDTIDKCVVWGYVYNEDGTPSTTAFTIRLTNDAVKYKTETIIRNTTVTVTPDANGYFEVSLIETENMEGTQGYSFTFGVNNILWKKIPNEASKNFLDLVNL